MFVNFATNKRFNALHYRMLSHVLCVYVFMQKSSFVINFSKNFQTFFATTCQASALFIVRYTKRKLFAFLPLGVKFVVETHIIYNIAYIAHNAKSFSNNFACIIMRYSIEPKGLHDTTSLKV